MFEAGLDDYAEVWVDGELPRALGQSGGSVIKGWNAPNRLVIARDAKRGQHIQIAVFGINGPLSDPPANFIWVRSAKLDFYPTDKPGPVALVPQEVNVEVQRPDPALDAIVPANPKIYKLAEGFTSPKDRSGSAKAICSLATLTTIPPTSTPATVSLRCFAG